jgi:bifunctional DNA-binding transcriptional regulator/antitoxin component of YhaV-PrlF toxin-antitoxin module
MPSTDMSFDQAIDRNFGNSDNLIRKCFMQPITTRIVGKFQVTVPPEVREIFGLLEGDLLEWTFYEASSQIRLIAKRAQLITPRVLKLVEKSKSSRGPATPAAAQTSTPA